MNRNGAKGVKGRQSARGGCAFGAQKEENEETVRRRMGYEEFSVVENASGGPVNLLPPKGSLGLFPFSYFNKETKRA